MLAENRKSKNSRMAYARQKWSEPRRAFPTLGGDECFEVVWRVLGKAKLLEAVSKLKREAPCQRSW